MTKHLQKIASVLSIMLFVAGAAFAQVTTSSLQGIVKGSDGETLIGATVIAKHEPSGTTYGSITNLDGRFNLANMRVGGPYSVEITYVGYQPARYTDLFLKLGEPFVLNASLNATASELDEIVITGTGEGTFNSQKTGAATNVNNEQINSLPQLNRSLLEFTRLTPQASGNSFAGRDARYNNLQIDGANFNNGFGLSGNPLPGGQAQPISLDAIEEITVNIAPYDITQSGFTGAGINAVTRSGTNTFSGSAYRFVKNQKLQGTKIGDNELERVDASTENFGFRLGGPIMKNKLFFFVNAEREELRGANASGTNLWRPSTNGVADPANNIARTTVADLQAVSNHLRNQWGYDPGRYEGYADEAFNYNTKFLARIDWNISEKHKLAVRYNQVVGISNQVANGTSGPFPRSPGVASRVSQNSITFENGNYGFENSVRSVTAELSSFFSNKVSNQFLATYSKIQDTRTTPGPLFPFVDIWDGGGRGNGDWNYMSFGTELFSFNNDVINDNYSFINNLTITQGKHTITAGAAFEVQKFGNSFTRSGASYYRYASVEDFLTTGTANEVAPIQFSLTYPYAGQETYARVNFGLGSLYAQDRIDVSNKLKLTVGIRAELPIYMNDLTANPSIDAITLLGPNGQPKNYSSGSWPQSRLMVSPRVGFNYDVKEDRSFIIRGGTGVFSGRVPFVWLTNMPTGAGVLQNTIEPGSYAQSAAWVQNMTFKTDPYYWVKNPPVNGQNVFISSPAGGAPGSFALVDDEFRMPMIWRSSLGTDIAVPNTPLVVTADFLYTRDINAVYQYGANRKTTGMSRMNAAGDTREIVLPGESAAYNTVMGANNATVLTNTDIKGHSVSMTIGATLPNYKGLSASLFYTYSMAKEVSSNAGSSAVSAWGGSPNINSPNDQQLNISAFAIPSRLVGSLNYRIEYANKLATTIGIFYTGESAGRFSYVYGNDLNNDGVNADLLWIPRNSSELNFVAVTQGGVTFTPEQQRAAFDAFIAANGLEEYRGSYAPRNAFLRPWLNRFDLRLLQDVFTNIGPRRHTIQFSFDIFNFGNMINSDWGIQQNLNGAQSLLSRSGAASANPNFNMNRVSGQLPTTPFVNASNFATTWSMQFGLRYIF